jgi:hypothetical protein
MTDRLASATHLFDTLVPLDLRGLITAILFKRSHLRGSFVREMAECCKQGARAQGLANLLL